MGQEPVQAQRFPESGSLKEKASLQRGWPSPHDSSGSPGSPLSAEARAGQGGPGQRILNDPLCNVLSRHFLWAAVGGEGHSLHTSPSSPIPASCDLGQVKGAGQGSLPSMGGSVEVFVYFSPHFLLVGV